MFLSRGRGQLKDGSIWAALFRASVCQCRSKTSVHILRYILGSLEKSVLGHLRHAGVVVEVLMKEIDFYCCIDRRSKENVDHTVPHW
jgi:hypothetical protein